jgi:hypothetical protein
MINFYETKAVKKYLNKKDNPSFDNTQIALNSRILVIGASGTGKTNWLLNYILFSPNTFSHIHVAFKEFEPLYEALRDNLKGKITFYDDLFKLPDVKEIRKNRDKDEEQLVIIDDYIHEIEKYPKVKELFIRGRKCNLTTIFISQSYFKIPKIMRSQMSYLVLLKVSSGKDLRLIMSDFALGNSLDDLQHIYKDATKIPMDFLKIDVGSGNPNKKFSKNWKDFYEVEKDDNNEKS